MFRAFAQEDIYFGRPGEIARRSRVNACTTRALGKARDAKERKGAVLGAGCLALPLFFNQSITRLCLCAII